MKDARGTLFAWLDRRDVLVRRFVLAEVLGPRRAPAWVRPGPTAPAAAAPAPAAERPDPPRGGALPRK